MSSLANNAIVAKAKAMYGKFLQPEDYDRMAKLKSIPDLVKYLQNHPHYEKTLKDVQTITIHRGHLEALIRKNRVEQIIKLIKLVYSKDKDFYMLDVVYQQNEIILSVLRKIISDDSADISGSIPFFYNVPTEIDFSKLLNVTNFADLLKALENTVYYSILKPFATDDKDKIRYIDIEHALEVYLYRLVFKTIDQFYHGKLKHDLEHLFKLRIDLNNITKIYRLKKFYNADPLSIRNVLVDEFSEMSSKTLDKLVMIEDPDQLLKDFDKKGVTSVAIEDEYVFIEYFTGKMRFELAKKIMYFSGEVPEIYTAFTILSQFELDNLIQIIEAIRYQINENEIKQMLIY
ncbi:MAG: V-type ATPase subunit [Acholeplasmataceae bacterium]